MALRFCDSFDHYATADFLQKWTDSGGGPAITAARNGSGMRQGSASHWRVGLVKTLDSQATWIIGFAFRFDLYPSVDQRILQLLDSGTLHVDLRITPTGELRMTRAGSSIGLGATILSVSTWYYIELKVTISDTGSFTVRINGIADANLNGVSADTRNAANASANQISLGEAAASSNSTAAGVPVWDDVYVCDATGGTNNDFLGDVRISAILPNGNGNSSQFDGSDGNQVDNYLLVDEAAPNDDTDYVQSGDVGDKDTYAFGDVTGSGTVYGVQTAMYARKTDAGTRSIVSVARSGASETDGSTKALSTSYLYYMDIRETKPGGGAYSISDVNAAEFGVKVAA